MKTAVLHLDRIGSSCCQLTKPAKTRVACPLRSPGITPVPHYYETVRPCSTDQYFRPRGASACAFSLSTAGRFSSSVPEPGIESRHLCTGHHMASKQVSAMPFPREDGPLRFRCHRLIRFDAFSVVHLRSSLYSTHDVIFSRLLTMTFTTAAFDRSSSWLFEACSYKPASKGLPSCPAQHRALTSAFLTQPLHGSGRAGFPHPALALGNDAHAPQGIGMTDRRQRRLLRYFRSVRLPRSVRHRRTSLDFPMRPKSTVALGEPGISRFPREVLPYVHGVSDRAGLWHTSRYRCTGWGLPHLLTASASRSNCLTRLNTRPARSLVNASTPPSRAAPHDSGPMWVAGPLSYDSFIHYTSPVLTGAPGEPLCCS